jgi:hypothetical protein
MNASPQAILNQLTALLQGFSNPSPSSSHRSSGTARLAPNPSLTGHNTSHLPHRTDLSPVGRGKNILAIFDSENLSYGYRKEGLDLDYGSLLSAIRSVSRRVEPLAFATVDNGPPLQYAEQYFKGCGWFPVLATARRVLGKREANSDSNILLHTGRILPNAKADVLLVGSGDGALVTAIVEYALQIPKPPRIVTICRSESLSSRLVAGRNPHIAANIRLGSDHVKPISRH